jgi:hypothetical protein
MVMAYFDFKKFFLDLTPTERDAFANRAGTTADYIETHLIAKVSRRQIPRKELMEGLAKSGEGCFTYAELLSFFYEKEEAA